jgi:hypothetical protein
MTDIKRNLRKQSRRQRLPTFSAEVKETWSYTLIPSYVFLAWCLIKHDDNFAFSASTYERSIKSCHNIHNEYRNNLYFRQSFKAIWNNHDEAKTKAYKIYAEKIPGEQTNERTQT